MKLSKIISLILVLCMSISCFAIFASAEDGGEQVKPKDDLKIVYNRNYDEGWGLKNGVTDVYTRLAKFGIEKEVNYDYSTNYFAMVSSSGKGTNDYVTIGFRNNIVDTGKLFIEFDVKAEPDCNIGDAFLLITKLPSDKREYFTSFIKGQVCLFRQPVAPCNGSWGHIALEFDYSDPTLGKNEYRATGIYTQEGMEPVTVTKVLPGGGGGVGIRELRIGYGGGYHNIDWYGFDNLKIYSGVDTFTELPSDNYGVLIDTKAEKDVVIDKEMSDGFTHQEKINQSLIMKKNVEWCLREGERVGVLEKDGKPYGAPVEIDGNVMVSFDAVLKLSGYPYFVHKDGMSFDIATGNSASYVSVGRKSATVNGERVDLTAAPGYVERDGGKYLVIALADVEKLFSGLYTTYDSMGLIVISKYKDLITRGNTSLESMMDLMRKFIFDVITEDEAYELAKEHTNNFTHPYLMVNQDRFDELRKVYLSKEGDPDFNFELYNIIKGVVDSGYSHYHHYCNVDENDKFTELKPERVPVNHNYEKYGDGYDVGGRLGVPSGLLLNVAFAYQITRDESLARFVYAWIEALCKWEHWGPGHFLNCADASNPIALAIDWCYNAFSELSLDVLPLIDGLYSHGVHMGFLATNDPSGRSIPYPRLVGGNGACMYTQRDNNWNAVCTFGMVASSLCILGEVAKPEYRAEGAFLISNNLQTLEEYGLQLYAPDGSYIESAGYWEYGTTNLFKLVMVLMSAYGDDFGLMDCWGLDRTCYFAYQVEDNDLHAYQYHDVGGYGAIDTSGFFFVGQVLHDDNIIAMRKVQLKNGKGSRVYDALYYVEDDEKYENLELELGYYMERVDGYVTRGSWEKGAMYAGIMAGSNAATHTQNDCGSFVYHNKGKVILRDLGAENYNAYKFWSREYIYYRKNTEGNNTLSLTSYKYGQEVNAAGKVDSHFENEHGNYVILDNTPVFGGKATYWRRGMFTTNDRNTVVIQDEVSFKGIQTVFWFAHYDLDTVQSVELSKDCRTAYLKSYNEEAGNYDIIRLSIVSGRTDLKFELMDCYTFVLEGTVDRDYSTKNGGQPEKSRDDFRKLAIRCESTLSFDVAVAIELVDPKHEVDVGYEFTEMKNWVPYEDERDMTETEPTLKRNTAKRTDIQSKLKSAQNLLETNKAFDTDIERYYRVLCDLEYTCLAFKDEDLNEKFVQMYRDKKVLVEQYDAFANSVNANIKTTNNLIQNLFG